VTHDFEALEELAREASTCTCSEGTIGGGVSCPTTSVKDCRVHGDDAPDDCAMGFAVGLDVLALLERCRRAERVAAAADKFERAWTAEAGDFTQAVVDAADRFLATVIAARAEAKP
jgi:hypothetical protein